MFNEDIRLSVDRVLATLIPKSMRAGIIPIVVAAVSVFSCSSPTDPLSDISAVVIPETVVRTVESSSGRVDVSLRFAIDNPTTDPIYYSHCGPSLERRKDDLSWELVASTICPPYAPADPLDGTLTIPAGQSREAGAFMSGYGADGLPSNMPAGTYRVRFAILSRTQAFWRGTTGIQYRGMELTTREFALSATN